MHRRTFITLAAAMLPMRLQAHSQSEFEMVAFSPPFPAPDITIQDLAGVEQRVGTGQENKFILLNFWATWCPPCVKEMPSLQSLQDKMDPAIFKVLAISADRPSKAERVRKFVQDLNLSFAIAHDLEDISSKTYGANEFPSTFLIGPHGNILSAAKGERVWDSAVAIEYFKDMISHHG